MIFLEFKNQFGKYPVFSVDEIKKFYPKWNNMNMTNWLKKNYIIKLRNKHYCFADKNIDELFLFYIANKLYKPSYISLETALSYYGIIPEISFTIFSVSTLKTTGFKNKLAYFRYSNIKEDCFFGYKFIRTDNFTVKIADIEKSLLDLLYLRKNIKTKNDILSLRFNGEVLKNNVNKKKITDYASLFNSKILFKKIDILNDLYLK